MESALSIKGQATIPKTIREHLHLKPGDRVKFFVHPDGSVVILPKLPTSALRGSSHRGAGGQRPSTKCATRLWPAQSRVQAREAPVKGR